MSGTSGHFDPSRVGGRQTPDSDFIDLEALTHAEQVLVWITTAALSGSIGNAAYDWLKSVGQKSSLFRRKPKTEPTEQVAMEIAEATVRERIKWPEIGAPEVIERRLEWVQEGGFSVHLYMNSGASYVVVIEPGAETREGAVRVSIEARNGD
ncbi:hypothetical protein [Actinoplanes derwentensis]|uniref:hypothetical protein n=1 Tax=Actinoplanes derwentensis TaxID=113562 RepID=UPI0012FE43CC|nr:hypothetical protein [Actinoplanes derwentensis]GID83262.1 hypothetical protein Ade03nite_21860 [Actinoplanes derwentensis]